MENPESDRSTLQHVGNAADECFRRTMRDIRTRKEWDAAIDVWNNLLDDAIANAMDVKDQFVRDANYHHAIIARDMIEYFKAMKATKDAPFPPHDPPALIRAPRHEGD